MPPPPPEMAGDPSSRPEMAGDPAARRAPAAGVRGDVYSRIIPCERRRLRGAPEAAPKTCNRGWHRLPRRPTPATGLRVTPINFMLQKVLEHYMLEEKIQELKSKLSYMVEGMNLDIDPEHYLYIILLALEKHVKYLKID